MKNNNHVYIAHRGLKSPGAPENTIAAIKNALNHNMNYEIDIQLTKDNKLVVFHDKSLKRLCLIDKDLKELTYDELKHLTIIGSKEKIPLLEEVLNITKGKVLIDIEVKYYNNPFKIVKILNSILKNYKGKYIIKSFNPFISWYYKKLNKNISCGVLSGSSKKSKFLNQLNYLKIYKPDFICYNLNKLNDKVVKKLTKYQIPLYLYTINNQQELKKAKKLSKVFITEKKFHK